MCPMVARAQGCFMLATSCCWVLVPLGSSSSFCSHVHRRRARIYRYDGKAAEWKERGTGELKLLKVRALFVRRGVVVPFVSYVVILVFCAAMQSSFLVALCLRTGVLARWFGQPFDPHTHTFGSWD